MRAEELVVSGASNNQSLPFLDYYLTFIHFFGYSIDPNDESQSVARRYYSSLIRVKQRAAASKQQVAAAAAAVADTTLNEPNSHLDGQQATQTSDKNQLMNNCALLINQDNPQRPGGAQEAPRRPALLKVLVKFYAITLTTFLTFNHIVVLVDYVLQGSKEFMQLMLELRLVITKFSALIFVLSWHQNQIKVRQLIKLVKSTSIYILAGESTTTAASTSTAIPLKANNKHLLDNFSNQTTDKLNRNIFVWFVSCVCIILIHFSLSEAEIRTAQHLWVWLDEYSLHTLSNRTTSISSLFIMATYDNYIYTVHVYGTRLIGASIICIVCTLQVENITCLRRQAVDLLRVLESGGVREADEAGQAGWAGQTSDTQDRRLFYVLAESDWRQVEANLASLRPTGWLSGPIGRFGRCLWGLARLQVSVCGRLSQIISCRQFAVRRRLGLATPNEIKSTRVDAARREAAADEPEVHFNQVVSSLVAQRRESRRRPTNNNNNSRRLLSMSDSPSNYCEITRGLATTRPAKADVMTANLATPNAPGTQRDYIHCELRDCYKSTTTTTTTDGGPNEIELQLERLARKYELVRTVNGRVDGCFGRMLLSQYSFLFLMSCIDVVYFSVSFSPNTKTKYIIISGMILLWLPYLLIYKYASDIGVASSELLATVRRLARLALVVQHSWQPQVVSNAKSSSYVASNVDFDLSPNDLQCPEWPELATNNKLFWPNFLSTFSFRFNGHRLIDKSANTTKHDNQQMKSRARIFNKLDHVFKQTNLSIVGILTVDKFFLLNFAKIVVTASVMTIQFISK